jgi:hypothetical protein
MPDPTPPRDLLQEALDWCDDHGLQFDLVNQNDPALVAHYGFDPRKVSAHFYIDDRSGPGDPFQHWYLIFLQERLAKLAPRAILAVDFDGTLYREIWPEIGVPNLPLIDTLCEAKSQGDRLTLWTCREHPKAEGEPRE